MCYAIPAKVLKIVNQETAKVDYGGVKKEINISLLENVSVGSYVLVHAGFAIEKVDTKSAKKTLSLVNEFLGKIEDN